MQRKRPEPAAKGKLPEEEEIFKPGPGPMSADNAKFEAAVHEGEDSSPFLRSEISPSEMRASIKRKMAEAERIEDADHATEIENEKSAVARPAYGVERDVPDLVIPEQIPGPGAKIGLNPPQVRALWIGVLAAVALLLFPPGPKWPSIYFRSGQHILDMMPPLIAVAVVTVAAVYTLKDRSSL